MIKLFSSIRLLAFLVFLSLSTSALALDLSQVITTPDKATADKPATGQIILMTPAELIKWANENKHDRLARLAVYKNPKLTSFRELYTWWQLQQPQKVKPTQADAEKSADDADAKEKDGE